MSKVNQFEYVTLDEKADLTFSGQFISFIDYYNRKVSLYLVESEYYVEVFYDEQANEIDFIALAAAERLGLYVDLNNLMTD